MIPSAETKHAARATLTAKLRELAHGGETTPCAGSDLWTSDDPIDLATAAAACSGCPAQLECREAGRGEAWGVWGGTVYGFAVAGARPGSSRWAALAALATAPGPLTRAELAEDAAVFGPSPRDEGARLVHLRGSGWAVLTDDDRVAITAAGVAAVGLDG